MRCRDELGQIFGRGHLLALIPDRKISNRRGIYEMDLLHALQEWRNVNGGRAVDLTEADIRRRLLSGLVTNATARQLARSENVSKGAIERESDLIQFQFPNRGAWLKALMANHLSRWTLASKIAGNLRTQQWIEGRLASALSVSDAECAEYFTAHQEEYSLPARYRASHLFLAAPAETPAPIVDEKCRAIDSLADRINRGESFSELVAQTSEDEATKMRGGDLGFFSESRMPPDFIAVVAQMHIGERSPPIQARLGFHIVELTDFKPPRQMNFEEARDEVRLRLANEKRWAAVQALAVDLGAKAEFMPGWF